MKISKIFIAFVSAFIATSAFAADPWPNRPIKFVVGFGPGGANDLVARAVAEAVVEYLRPMRERALELLQDEAELIKILNKGADKARVLASKTLKEAYQALGILG